MNRAKTSYLWPVGADSDTHIWDPDYVLDRPWTGYNSLEHWPILSHTHTQWNVGIDECVLFTFNVCIWFVSHVRLYLCELYVQCSIYPVLTRRDQMFMRPPTPPDARARPSGLKASVLTGVMWPFSWKTHTAPSPDHWEGWNTVTACERKSAQSLMKYTLKNVPAAYIYIYRERENTQHDNQGFCRFQHVKFKIFLSPLCPLRPISHPNWQKNNTKDMKENQSKLIYSSVMLTMWIHNNVGWCQVLYVFLTSQTTNAFTHKVLLHFKLKLWSYLTKFHL